MERFSIDESGYTGFDLLNSDRRFQGASAISITDEMARERPLHHTVGRRDEPGCRSRALGIEGRTSGEGRVIMLVTHGVTQGRPTPAPKIGVEGRAKLLWDKAEAEGLEPPRACARRISSAVPYQLGLRLQGACTKGGSAGLADARALHLCLQSGRLDLNQRPLRPERSALPG